MRAEKTYYSEEFLSLGMESVLKELRASQLPNLPQALDYSSLFSEEDSLPLHQEARFIRLKCL
jgi:hypothetical protein